MLHKLARLFGLWATTKHQGRPTKQARPQLGVEGLEARWAPATLQGIDALLTHSAEAVIGNYSPDEAQGKVSMQDFHFTKTVEKASPRLFLTAGDQNTQGKTGPTMPIPQQDYLKIRLTDILVSS